MFVLQHFQNVGFGRRMRSFFFFCLKGIAITVLLKHVRAFVGTLFHVVDCNETNKIISKAVHLLYRSMSYLETS